MEIKVIKGDLLNTDASVICHQVNCVGAFGSGVAYAIGNKWPLVREKYLKACKANKDAGNPSYILLGKIQVVQVVGNQRVINLFGQDSFGSDGKRYTSYDAIDSCLNKVRDYCIENKIMKVAFPYKMCSDRGGADWEAILSLIKAAFRTTNITLEIRKL